MGSCKFLKRYEDEEDSFLTLIMTVNDSWVHHFEIDNNRQSLVWNNNNKSNSRFCSHINDDYILAVSYTHLDVYKRQL